MKAYTMLLEDLTTVANQAKEITISTLLAQKVITQKQADEFSGEYTIVVTEKGRLGTFFDKLTFKTANDTAETRMICLKKA